MKGIKVDLEKLRGAILNKSKLAERMGIARYSLYRKLQGKQKLDFNELNLICAHLGRNAMDFVIEFEMPTPK